MQARSALFDLYGDYLRSRGGYAPVAALVALLRPLGVAAPAVRTAVSRMVRQGWLVPARLTNGAGYALTPKAVRRVDEAAARIYRTTPPAWKGSFDLLMVEPPPSRTARSRLASNLRYLGYGQLSGSTWIAPRPASEVDGLLDEAGLSAERFTAEPAGGTPAAVRLVHRAWDLDTLAEAHRRFVEQMRPVVRAVRPEARQAAGPSSAGSVDPDEAAFTARFRLVHAWRSFLFRDPQLPAELLPDPWPGVAAASFFDQQARRLRPAADRYVDARLTGDVRHPNPTEGVL